VNFLFGPCKCHLFFGTHDKKMNKINRLHKQYFYFLLFIFTTCICSCNNPDTAGKAVTKSDTLSPEQQHLPENALKGLAIKNGLEVATMAIEPMIKNPTNIDVDERGRVWVTEAYNYRPAINNNPVNPLGDRIMI